PRLRPKMTHGYTMKMRTGCGNMYVTINEDEHGPCEIFTQLGKSGGCTMSQSEAVARLVSLALRAGINPMEIIEQLRGIRCPSPAFQEGKAVLSCPDAMARSLEDYLKERSLPSLFNGKKGEDIPGASNIMNALAAAASSSLAVPAGNNPNSGTGVNKAQGGNVLNAAKRKGNAEGMCPECPECGNMLEFGEGCVKCHDCGYSKCG
ncbi:MAG: TSCPD domain-containing protein, partial [Elusimicrobiota bacterium]